jgi:hypothetical protein
LKQAFAISSHAFHPSGAFTHMPLSPRSKLGLNHPC